ncbi:MAG: hypothetical protein KDC49_14565 [Saprospiraceae bacterium]|nr:hypothetical protein [Saprospiraceae bacterium]
MEFSLPKFYGVFRPIVGPPGHFLKKFPPRIISFCLLLILLVTPKCQLKAQDIKNNAACEVCAQVQTYPQLASVNTNDGVLTAYILGNLLGTNVDLTALNWQGLAQSSINVLDFLSILQADLGLSSPQEVLEADLSLAQIFEAAALAGSNGGTIAELNQLASLSLPSSTIRLSDLMTLDLIQGYLAEIEIDALSFVTGVIQVYNFENVATTPSPVSINLPIGNVQLWAQVVEPPHIGCFSSSGQFFSAGVRIKLSVDIVDNIFLNTNITLPLVLTSVDVSATLTNIDLYLDVASGLVTVDMVNSVNNTISLTAQPGLASIYVGDIDVNDFFNRSAFPLSSLDFGVIGSVALKVNAIVSLTENLDLKVKSNGSATNGAVSLSNYAVPFGPLELGSSSTVISELLDDLALNTQIDLTSTILPVNFIGPVTSSVLGATSTILFNENTGVVPPILTGLADPLLGAMGIGIGEIIVGSTGVNENCFDFADAPNSYSTTKAVDGACHIIGTNLYIGNIPPDIDDNGMPGVMADGDGADEDGFTSSGEIVSPTEFRLQVMVNNFSGNTAQLVAWIDFNQDGSFDNNYERSVYSSSGNVPDGFSDNVTLEWTGIPFPYEDITTYLRIRLTSEPSFFTNASPDPTGVARDGEVEDHMIQFSLLPVQLISFGAEVTPAGNLIKWTVASETNIDVYEVLHSTDANNFEKIASVSPSIASRDFNKDYEALHANPEGGLHYYKLSAIDQDGSTQQSHVILIQNNTHDSSAKIFPNPCIDVVNVMTGSANISRLMLFDAQGKMVQSWNLVPSNTGIALRLGDNISDGMYFLLGYNDNESGTNFKQKLLVKKQ